MNVRWIALVLVLLMVAAGCGDDSSTTNAGAPDSNESGDGSGGDGGSGGNGSGGSGGDGGSGGNGGGDGDGSSGGDGDGSSGGDGDGDSGDGGIDNNATGDDDDFGDIIGDEDFDPDVLDDDTADMIDDIDDIVSVGDCVAETMGIGAVAPEGWFCTVLDTPISGFDGFTLKSSDRDLEIIIGSPSPVGPCDFEGICENVTPVDIPGFDDAISFDQFGVASGMYGNNPALGAALTVTNLGGSLTDDDIAFIQAYVGTLAPLS